MICSLKTCVLDVARGSREGKPTSSEGACVRGELRRMLWFTFTLHKCESNFTLRGKGYSSSQLLREGIWTTKERWQRVLASPYHSSFRVVLKEKQFAHSICIPTRKAISYQMIDWLTLIGYLSFFFIKCLTIPSYLWCHTSDERGGKWWDQSQYSESGGQFPMHASVSCIYPHLLSGGVGA